MKLNKIQKLDVKDITPKHVEECNKWLEGLLNNVNKISKEEVEEVVNLQDEEGSFKPFVGKWIHSSDSYIDAVKYPTVLALSILMNVDLLNISSINKDVFTKAFAYISEYGLRGHGYEASETELRFLTMLYKNGLKHFLNKHEGLYPSFKSYITSLTHHYRDALNRGETTVGFGSDIKENIIELLDYVDNTLYVAYGSNLNKIQMCEDRCKGSVPVTSLMLKGYRLTFHLFLTVEKDEQYDTPVVIWKISNKNEQVLDSYEGVSFNTYRKEFIILPINGENRLCLIYIMNYRESRWNKAPSYEYYETCLQGYKDFDLNIKYLVGACCRVKDAYNK